MFLVVTGYYTGQKATEPKQVSDFIQSNLQSSEITFMAAQSWGHLFTELEIPSSFKCSHFIYFRGVYKELI